MGGAPLRLRPLALSAEGRDRGLPIALGHLEVSSRVISQVWVVVFVTPAQSESRELGAPHVRLQLLKRQRPVSTSHFNHLLEAN